MRVLVVGASSSIDDVLSRKLRMHGYEMVTAVDIDQGMEMIHQSEIQCVLVDIDLPPAVPMGLADIRQLGMSSAVVLMTASGIPALICQCFAAGSIQLLSLSEVAANIEHLTQPALLVSSAFRPDLARQLREEGMRVSSATTLQFAMNLLVDGWCQIVLLQADLPDLAATEQVAVFHEVGARELAILASVRTAGFSNLNFSLKPQQSTEFLELIRETSENRPQRCGFHESHGKLPDYSDSVLKPNH